MVLNRLGLNIGHEVAGLDGMADWHGVANPAGYDIVLHQVRNPFKTIGSCHTFAYYSWQFVCEHEPRILLSDSLTLKCMKYWLYWNEQAGKLARWTYRVEDLKNQTGKILGLFDKPLNSVLLSGIDQIDQQVHTRKNASNYRILTFKDLLAEDCQLATQIIQKAKDYGYPGETL
jgi:hypothetical protein